MEGARDLALEMANRGEGKLLDQFNNPDNPYAHYTTTGPEIWQQTGGRITHFVSSMGTTGTITGVSRFMREQSKPVTIVGAMSARGQQHSRHSPLAYGISAGDFQRFSGG